MSRTFQLPATTVIGGEKDHLMLSDILYRLKSVYCTHIGLEYMHINDRAKCKREREREEGKGGRERGRERERCVFKKSDILRRKR